MNKKLVSLILTGSMLFSLAACGQKTTTANSNGQGATTAGEKPKAGVTIYKFDDNFMSFVRGAIQKNAEGKLDLTLSDSQNDQAKQNEQVDTFVSKGVKTLAINLVTPQAADQVIAKAKGANLPVVFFNKEPDANVLNSYDKAYYIGTNSQESGVIQGQLILDLWKKNPSWDKNKDGKIQYVLLKGEPGHPDAEARTKFSIETITKGGVQVEQLDLQTGMWDTAKGKDIMDAWISRFQDKIEFVIANNDGMALGALASLEAAGYTGNKQIPIVGVDAIPDVLTKISEGKIAGTVLNDAGNQGKAIVDVLLNLSQGKNPTEGTSWKLENKAIRVPYKAITKENLDEAKKSYGQ